MSIQQRRIVKSAEQSVHPPMGIAEGRGAVNIRGSEARTPARQVPLSEPLNRAVLTDDMVWPS